MLVLTVGGSPEPLLHHIAHRAWDRVVFVCSEDDPVSGKAGSHATVDDLAARAGLDEARAERLLVPADDPGIIHDRCLGRIRAERAAGATVVADYTGGTKSMSAGLLLAALTEGADIDVVLGPRTDHVKVRSGTQQVVSIDTSVLESHGALAIAARAWSRFDYAAAAEALSTLRRPTDEARRLRQLSIGYARWTAFDYRGARDHLLPFGRFVPQMAALTALATDSTRDTDAARIVDLWLASERHARAERFDLAVLLLYRANEAIAQWALRWEHGIDPGDIAEGSPVVELASTNHAGKRVLGQHAAWQALGRLGGALAEIARATERSRLDLSVRRNESVLAHGAKPLTEDDHARVREWFAQEILPGFEKTAYPKGRKPPGQLPDAFPR